MSWAPPHLLSLPVEIIGHVLGFLDVHDLVSCSSVAKELRKIIDDSIRLQYTIELAKRRMVSILHPSDKIPYASRLKILRDRERAWKMLSWSSRHRLKLPPTGSVYEFVGGFYGNGKEDEERVTASISFLELPSADSDSAIMNSTPGLRTWTHPMLDVMIIDFTMDPSQDLLVLIALATSGSGYVYELHLRSLLTNEPHPKATLAVLPCLLKPSHVHQHSDLIAPVRVQVSGSLVALLVKEVHDSTGAHLEIWDWVNNPQNSCQMARITGIDDFTFLSQEAFLLVRPTGNFEVYTFSNPITCFTIPICQASYAFPPLADGFMYWYITMSSNPAPGTIPQTSTETRSGQQTYYPKPDERIHACCLYIFNPSNEDHDHRVHCFVFFVNIHTLLNPPVDWLKPRMSYKGHSLRGARSFGPLPDMDTEIHDVMEAIPFISSTSSHPQSFPYGIAAPAPSSYVSIATRPVPAPAVHLSAGSSSIGHPPGSIQMPTYVPWAVWGPQSTRWFQECLSTDWQHSIYGLRTVESVTVEKMGRPTLFGLERGDTAEGASADGARISESASMTGKGGFVDFQDLSVDAGAGPIASGSGVGGISDENGIKDELRIPPRFLRLRDYNPYSVMQRVEEERQQITTNSKGKDKMRWSEPRVITEPSTTVVKGVFREDIVSCLPYVEVVSEDMFEITDVMMDDCRLLLLRRGDNGKLSRVDVLTL